MFLRQITIISLIHFLLLSIALNAQHKEKDKVHHALFEHQSFSMGFGLPYSFELESSGINARFYYNLGERICMGPEISYFRNGDTEIIDGDFIIHYIFETPITGIYPLIGVNYTVENEEHHTEKAFGLVWGFGAHRNIKSLTFFLEYSRIESDLNDSFITAGAFFTLRSKK